MKPGRRQMILGMSVAVLVAALGIVAVINAAADRQPQAPIFEVDPLWPNPLPSTWLLGSAVGVAVDARDHVFVVNLTDSFTARTEIGAATDPPTGECCRPSPNVLEFDPEGDLVNSWGGSGSGYGWPSSNHGIAVDPQGNVWIGGSGGTDSHLLKFSNDGNFLMQVGMATSAAAAARGGGAAGDTATGARGGRGGRGRGRGGRGAAALPPSSTSAQAFGGPADLSFDASANEAFVADGYRNRRVAVIDMNTGAIKRFFGAYGEAPVDAELPDYDPAAPPARQFGTPVTCAALANDGLLYVCDRSRNRIQVFRKDGTFVSERVIAPATRGQGSVWDVAFSHDPQQRFLYVADGMNMKVHILDRQSLEPLTSFGDGGRQPGQFFGVHSIAVDSQGNIYTVETHEGKRLQKFVFRGLGPVTTPDRGVVWPDTIR